MDRDEALVGTVIFLLGAVTSLLSLKMPIGTFRMAGTGMFPLILGILLMVLSGVFILKNLFQNRGEQIKKGPSIKFSKSNLQLILFLGAMGLATLFLKQLGYPITSFLLMVALLRTLGMKRWGLNLLISIVTSGGSYILFVKWLAIPMPKGWIGL